MAPQTPKAEAPSNRPFFPEERMWKKDGRFQRSIASGSFDRIAGGGGASSRSFGRLPGEGCMPPSTERECRSGR